MSKSKSSLSLLKILTNRHNCSFCVLSISLKSVVVVCTETLSWVGGGGDKGGISVPSELNQFESARGRTIFTAALLL